MLYILVFQQISSSFYRKNFKYHCLLKSFKFNGFSEKKALYFVIIVIQGSVLGPILFLFFIADINDELPKNCDLQKYADDILAYIIGKSIPEGLPQAIVDAISRWCVKNKMHLNIEKCKTMVLSKDKEMSQKTASLIGITLETVSSYKYLGVELNNTLDWNQQWVRVQKITSSTPYLIGRLKRCGFRTELLVNAYRSYGLSHFTYSAPLLTSTSAKSKDEMRRYHQRMLDIIGISPERALKKYKLGTVEQLIDQTCIKLLTRVTNELDHPLTRKLSKSRTKAERYAE